MIDQDRLYDRLGNCHPKLSRGQVWCRKCGASQRVNSAECFRSGWPKCCGETMTIDSPAERVIFYCRGDYGRGLMSGAMLDAAIDDAMGKEASND